MKKGDYAVRNTRKVKHKLNKWSEIKKPDAFQKLEGIQYQPQGFHTNSKILKYKKHLWQSVIFGKVAGRKYVVKGNYWSQITKPVYLTKTPEFETLNISCLQRNLFT